MEQERDAGGGVKEGVERNKGGEEEKQQGHFTSAPKVSRDPKEGFQLEQQPGPSRRSCGGARREEKDRQGSITQVLHSQVPTKVTSIQQ